MLPPLCGSHCEFLIILTRTKQTFKSI
jgi:hypothetical protein